MTETLLGAGAALYGAAWEARRRAYARGLVRPRRVPSRVVSIGNLTAGGTGKTTLTLHLARLALERGRDVAVVCRRYRPGPTGWGDEERLYVEALGKERVMTGAPKHALAARAAAAGRTLVLVDDGFSHWRLERDLDLVLIDAQDPWGGGRLLPAGRMREPHRALQRAGVLVISRLGLDHDPGSLIEEVRRLAPAALIATARHAVVGARGLDGSPRPAEGPAWIVTATGNPGAVERSAREAGYVPAGRSCYRDHHWFSRREALAELGKARAAGATLLLTAKDAVRWPSVGEDSRMAVLEITWQWVSGGDRVEKLILGDGEAR